MPRPKRRAATTSAEVAETASSKRPKTTTSSRSKQASEESKFSTNRLISWFKKYTSDDPSQLGPEGMERFCKDIKLEPENIAMLCIAYKMNAKNMGYFTQSEWVKGLADPEVQCDTPTKLQNKLHYFYNLMDDPQIFKFIFRYAYDFARVSQLTFEFFTFFH
jgi:DCN1-like protein 4/5